MAKILIVGIDSLVGRSLGQYLATRCSVSGMWFDDAEFINGCPSEAMDHNSLTEQTAAADVVVFCGGASRSSWDDQFGTFTAERNWLKSCIDAAATADTQMVFVSSDAVFSGPWVFHDDASPSAVVNRTAKTIAGFEAQVAALTNSLVVRTNVLGWKVDSFLGERLGALMSGRRLILDATTFSTPIAEEDFAPMLAECLQRHVSGYINIGGGERTSPFGFMTLLSASLDSARSELTPNTITREFSERSLRCSRLRHEVNQHTPMLKGTIEAISEPAREQAHAAAA